MVVFTEVKIYTIFCTAKFTINNLVSILQFYLQHYLQQFNFVEPNFLERNVAWIFLYFLFCDFFLTFFLNTIMMNVYLQEFIYNENACER